MTVEQPIIRPSEPVRHKITVAEFLALEQAGFFEDARVELIDGEIFEMAPLHRPHARIVPILSIALDQAIQRLSLSMEVLAKPSAELGAHNLPQADIVVADIADEDLVSLGTLRLMVEVAASSLGYDLGPKLRLYARSGVPEYWVVDVDGREIIRFHSPQDEDYRERANFAFGEPVPSAIIAGLTVDTSRLT